MSRNYEEKLKSIFPDLIVKKSLSASQEVAKIPRFISEYLIQKATEKATNEKEITKKVNEFISRYRPEIKDREFIKSKILEEGSIKILEFFEGYTDIQEELYYVDIPILGIKKVVVPKSVKDQNENLLRGGMWGLGTIGFCELDKNFDTEKNKSLFKKLLSIKDKEKEGERKVLSLLGFTPFQFTRCDIKYFQDARNEFTFDEWLNLLINTIGPNPEKYETLQEKLALISRLIPFVEENVFLAEFGEPATGKTYLYDKLSSYSRVISGSIETPANLFYHGGKRKPGILATCDVVLFDEIDKLGKRKMEPEVVGKLLKFMESGIFDRAGQEVKSGCSVVFGGNLKEYQIPLYKLFPKEMQHKAFFDRIFGFLPGEVLPRFGKSKEFISRTYGLASDYFSEVMHRMRNLSFIPLLKQRVDFVKGDARDEKAVLKIASGLIKLLYPNGELTKDELKMVVDFAVYIKNRAIKEIKSIDEQAPVKEVGVEVVE